MWGWGMKIRGLRKTMSISPTILLPVTQAVQLPSSCSCFQKEWKKNPFVRAKVCCPLGALEKFCAACIIKEERKDGVIWLLQKKNMKKKKNKMRKRRPLTVPCATCTCSIKTKYLRREKNEVIVNLQTAAFDRFRHETCLMIGNWLGKLPMTYGTKQCGITDDDFDLGTLKTEDVHEDITDSIVFLVSC